jgi:hypothetical protein
MLGLNNPAGRVQSQKLRNGSVGVEAKFDGGLTSDLLIGRLLLLSQQPIGTSLLLGITELGSTSVELPHEQTSRDNINTRESLRLQLGGNTGRIESRCVDQINGSLAAKLGHLLLDIEVGNRDESLDEEVLIWAADVHKLSLSLRMRLHSLGGCHLRIIMDNTRHENMTMGREVQKKGGGKNGILLDLSPHVPTRPFIHMRHKMSCLSYSQDSEAEKGAKSAKRKKGKKIGSLLQEGGNKARRDLNPSCASTPSITINVPS